MLDKIMPFGSKKRRLSLSVYISLLLALASIVPLLVTVGSIEIFLRPALITQISSDMEKNAQTRIQLIDTYLSERTNDVKTLSEAPTIKSLLKGQQGETTEAQNVLITTQHRDIANYISLSLIDTHNNVVLTYPSKPTLHGKSLILPEALAQMQQSNKVVISDVFYNLTSNTPSVDFYSRVIDDNFHILGYVRVSLGLHRVWQPVDSEPQANGAGSYASIVDQNGVRIAYTNPDFSGFTHPTYLFKPIAPLSSNVMQRISTEELYGNDSTAVTPLADPALASFLQSNQSNNISQLNPAGQNQTFETAQYSSKVVPWTYIIFKPLNVVTGLADQQLLSIFLIVALVLIVVVFGGFFIGRGLALPILRSVTLLRKSSDSLKTMAGEESTIAMEQTWMVEASQVALKSVQYYTNATATASNRISMLSTHIAQGIHNQDGNRVQQLLQDLKESAAYIERTVKHQETMNDKLAMSLRVTTQASEQLTKGATATNEAASQMEYIVGELTSVVGE